MNNFSFENQGTNTFLVYAVQPDETLDTTTLGMLTGNKIPGLAATLYTRMDTKEFIKFNVSAKVPLNQFFSGSINRKKLIGVFNGILEAVANAEDYMIDSASILLDQEYIYTDVSTCETSLICMPIYPQIQQPSLHQFFKSIIGNLQYDQSEDMDYVVKLMNYLNGTAAFSVDEFRGLLNKVSMSGPAPTPRTQTASSTVRQNQQPVVRTTTAQQVTPQTQTSRQPITPGPSTVSGGRQPLNTQPGNFNTQNKPGPQPKPVQPVNPNKQPQPDGKKQDKMSFLYLMRHYTKENAEIYKKQKEGKEGEKVQGKAPAKSNKKKPVKAQEPDFAVPGQKAQQELPFAVPGQPPRQDPLLRPENKPTPPAGPASGHADYREQPVISNLSQVPSQQSVASTAVPGNFGNTTVLSNGSGMGETTVLTSGGNGPEQRPYLLRAKNNEKVPINKDTFRIGKEKSYVDYFIGDNPAISRSHANLITRNGEYFIVDTNSTNHTFVNGEMIQSNVETKLNHGSRVTLANEDFEFRTF